MLLVRALKTVVLPLLGKPTIPISKRNLRYFIRNINWKYLKMQELNLNRGRILLKNSKNISGIICLDCNKGYNDSGRRPVQLPDLDKMISLVYYFL